MNRRAFLKGLGVLGALTLVGALTGCKDQLARLSPSNYDSSAALDSAASPLLTGDEIRLTAEPVRWELAPGKIVEAWAYNGRVPGPEIRVKEGERIRIVLLNELPEPTTIHWHGVDVPNAMDGVPFVTQEPVPPGGRFVYEFIAKPAGTRWYHTHVNEHKQLELGLYAPLIIEPALREPYDREYTLVLDDWVTGIGASAQHMMHGRQPAYDTFTINGKAWPATQPLLVREGERVKLRLINTSATEIHTIYVEGHSLKVTHTDGNSLVTPEEVDAVQIAPAERVDVELLAHNPGIWELRCLDDDHAQRGMKTVLQYEGFSGRVQFPPATREMLRIWSYGSPNQGMMGMDMSSMMSPDSTDGKFSLTLSGGMMMNPDVWTINGRAYPNTEPLWVRQGDRVQVRLFNMSMESHPMHLHGHSFKVTAVNGQPTTLIKDTVNVGHMENVDIEFAADNPGTWFFHCHKPMHMKGGMVTLVKYR